MAIASRQDLADYCLRKLGAPVIEINVDDDQLSDRIDEALQFYQEYHSDAIVDSFFKYQITADDVTNQYITLPEELQVVRRVLPLNNGSSGAAGMFNVNYQLALSDAFLLRGGQFMGNLSSYAMTQNYISMMNNIFGSRTTSTRFNRHMDRLFIDIDWGSTLSEGEWVIIDGSATVDPETYTDVYNDMFLKRYATSLIKQQWGQNLSKFEGMQLPGGVTISGRQILDEAREEIAKIEEEMQLRYEMPADFFIG